MTRRPSAALVTALVFGYAFLYGPIAALVVYSFNESRLVAVWSGFSVRWYVELLANEKILAAAWLSLRIAAVNATAATALGALAAVALARLGRGRLVLATLITAPVVMPEVITGLSLLLLFVALDGAIGWPAGRGATTITLAHITFSMCYATFVIGARLRGLDPALEDAAADLGARPARVFLSITLPLLAPALAAAWLLAFTLSLDDVVIASFVSGPGASTLPIVVFASVRLGVSPQINALATLFLLVVGGCIVLAGLLVRRQERQRARDTGAALRR